MRRALHISICLLAVLAAGCASKKEPVARLEGSEPQRLSFGTPQDVQAAFTKQMQTCWFNEPSPLLEGYSFDTTPAQFETANGRSTLLQVTIRNDDGDQQFVVQFFPFNKNTLISTRNLAMPLELAGRLKRDIETWIFGREDCGDRARLLDTPTTSPAPQISSSQIQEPQVRGRETAPAEDGLDSTTIY
ncbi:MAG: hypothetical protein KTR19_04455 [Hyphomicrobiales bacterium]|nr:hypothetical protein [Hyphomicrobiales bacterium]